MFFNCGVESNQELFGLLDLNLVNISDDLSFVVLVIILMIFIFVMIGFFIMVLVPILMVFLSTSMLVVPSPTLGIISSVVMHFDL